MLDSVLVARDKFLKEDGVLFPDRCELFAAPCSLPSLNSRWDDVCDVSMSLFAYALRKSYSGRPKIMSVPAEDLLTEGHSLVAYSLKYVTTEELDDIPCKFFAVSKVDAQYEGICMWFTVTFPALSPGSQEVVLSTASDCPATHWEQTVIVLQDELIVEKDTLMIGSLKLKRSQVNPRFYDIEFEYLDPESEEHPVPCNCCHMKCKIIKAMSLQYDERDDNMDGVD